MKKIKQLLIVLVTLCFILSGCQGGSGTADSEKAMENFLAKLEEGNYVIDAKDYLKTTVSSRDQVTFEYAEDIYTDFAVMSVNNETFQGVLTDNGIEDVVFYGEGQAIDAASRKLPNYWMDESVSDGNIWNLFYNIQEEPLKFMSHEDIVKQTVISLVGYGQNALGLMEDVYLTLDKEDPTTARIQAIVNDDMVARVFYDDIDLEIVFGKAESNPIADAWMEAPVYPEGRTEWNETDEFIFNSVFLPGYGLEAIPFPAFASYALKVDEENFVDDDAVYIRDHQASESDMAEYIDTLLADGFEEVKDLDEEGNEKTYYRKLLREDFNCYSSIELEYDNGVSMTAKKHYDCPIYDSLDEINAVIKKAGYPALKESDNFISCKGTDRADEMTESWLYFFTYDLGLYVETEYEDYDKTLEYLKEYENTLLDNGFKAVASTEEEPDYYESENGFYSFRYAFLEDGKVTLLFKSEKYISAKEAEKMIKNAGFPAISLSEPITCRDLKLFDRTRYGRDEKASLSISQQYESAEQAEAFLDAYEASLNAAGFERVSPDTVGTYKAIAIYNEEKNMYVAIDYFPESAQVNFDFVAE